MSVTLVFLLRGALSAETPLIDVTNCGSSYSFGGKSVVLFHAGDSSVFSSPGYDDSGWKTVSLPHYIKKTETAAGVCWYRIHFRLFGPIPEKNLGISLGLLGDLDEIYLNGRLIGSNGGLTGIGANYYGRFRTYELPSACLVPGGGNGPAGTNVIAVRLRLYYDEGGFVNGFYAIAPYDRLLNGGFIRDMVKMVFVIIYLVISAVFLLFYFKVGRNSENLYFGLFSLAAASYFFMHTQIKFLTGWDYFYWERLEYCILFTLFPLFTQFIISFFRFKLGKPLAAVLYAQYLLSLAAIILVLFTSSQSFWNDLNQYVVQISWTVPVGTVVTILVREFKKNREARLVLYSFLALLIFVVYDIIGSRYNEFFGHERYLTTYGLLLFVVAIAVIIANRFMRLYKQVGALNEDLKRSYEIIQKNHEELQQIDRIKSELISNVSHQMQTPITNMYGMMELLLEKGAVGQKQKDEMLPSVFREIKVLKKIINNFIILSVLDTGNCYLREVNLLELLNKFEKEIVQGEFGDIIARKGLKVRLDIMGRISPGMQIVCDEKYFNHMLFELFHNAVSYNRQGGEITVDAAVLKRTLSVSVRDTGIGIAGDKKAKVFDRFYRADYSSEVEGMGLGLSVVRLICQKLGYKIRLESGIGQGTEIVVDNIYFVS